jgi:hypothetical protein
MLAAAMICRRSAGAPKTLPSAPAVKIEPTEPAENIEPTEPAEATEKADAAEPIEPTDRTDPIEPIDSSEPSLAIDRIESREAKEIGMGGSERRRCSLGRLMAEELTIADGARRSSTAASRGSDTFCLADA